MKFTVHSVGLFCGAQSGHTPLFKETAFEVGRVFGQKGIRLVYGGSKDGLMGAAADGALSCGGEVLGVLPEKLAHREVAHRGIQRLLTVDSMALRKDLLIRESDLFMVLPGGLGTLDELFEVLTANTLGFISKPVIILNTSNFYSGLIDWLEKAAAAGLSKSPKDLFHVVSEVSALSDVLHST
jgi:uncharacterized protein (TIGR00730 family)